MLLRDRSYDEALHRNNDHKLKWDKAIVDGDLDLIIELNKLGYKFQPSDAILHSAREGHEHLVKFFINLGANDWNWGMMNAISGGHKDLIAFFEKRLNN